MATKTTDQQLSSLRLRLAEPATGGRFTPATLIDFLNEGRRWVAEETKSHEVRDGQSTVAGTKRYTLPPDIIDVITVQYDGVELDIVEPEEWRGRIGDDDTIEGTPLVYKIFARQIQIFHVPGEVKTLEIEGPGYPGDLAAGGIDVDFFIRQQEASIWRAVAMAKASDDRNPNFDQAQANGVAAELARQVAEQKGPRKARTTDGEY